MAKGLLHLNSLLVVHRDVKADNMMLGAGIGGVARAVGDGRDAGADEDVLLVVSDLGESLDCTVVARQGFEVPAAFPSGGAPAYHSPEVCTCVCDCVRGPGFVCVTRVCVRICLCVYMCEHVSVRLCVCLCACEQCVCVITYVCACYCAYVGRMHACANVCVNFLRVCV